MDAIKMTLDDLIAMCACDVRLTVYGRDNMTIDKIYDGYASYSDVPADLLELWVTDIAFYGDGKLIIETEERY